MDDMLGGQAVVASITANRKKVCTTPHTAPLGGQMAGISLMRRPRTRPVHLGKTATVGLVPHPDGWRVAGGYPVVAVMFLSLKNT